MAQFELVVLQRDTRAILIPDGEEVFLPEGTQLRITQSLGGTHTVLSDYGQMFRIDERDADALGKQAPEEPRAAADDGGGSLEERVWARLKTCFDPEIPVNIVDLGLVYSCELREPDGEEGREVDIKMTLTAPGCGMGDILADDVERKVGSLPGIVRANVEIVLDPPWNQGMMSEMAKLELGMM